MDSSFIHTKTLNLNNVPLVGRSEQLKALQHAYETFLSHDDNKTDDNDAFVVYVEGETGTGKSYLVECWLQQEQQKEDSSSDFLLGKGKYDQRHHAFGGIVQALQELLRRLDLERFRRSLLINSNVFPKELLNVLGDLLPMMKTIVSGGYVRSDSHQSVGLSSEDVALYNTDDDDDDECADDASPEKKSRSSSSLMEFKSGLEQQICTAIRMLLRFISRDFLPNQPIILFLDDIHLADENSRTLLQTLLLKNHDSELLLQGVFILLTSSRPKTTDEQVGGMNKDSSKSSPRHDALRDSLLAGANRTNRTLITLDDLGVEDVNHIVSQLTELSRPSTLPLSEVIYEKTKGNCYFVLHYLLLLQRRNLLYFSMTEVRWCWEDITRIKNQTDLADNVAAVVTERIHHALEEVPETQHVLQIAANLGSTFESRHLAYILNGMEYMAQQNNEREEENMCIVDVLKDECGDIDVKKSFRQDPTTADVVVESSLKKAMEARLVESVHINGQQYKFSHDRVQQSFLEIQVDNTFLYRIGLLILRLYGSHLRRDHYVDVITNDRMLFAALEALNRVSDDDDDDECILDGRSCLALARLNFRAGSKATASAAFHVASNYLSKSVSLLRKVEHAWERHYGLTVRLYKTTVKVECTCGNHDHVETLVGAILAHARRNEDKFDAHVARVISLQAQSKLEAAFEHLMVALRAMGEKFPKKKPGVFHLALSAMETKRCMSRKSDVDILSLPQLLDKHSRDRMTLLSMAFLNSYYRCEENWMVLIMRRLVCRTVQLGLTKQAPLGFAAYAKYLAKTNSFKEAGRFGKIATYLIDQLHVKEHLSVTVFFLSVFVEHLNNPMYGSLASLKHAFDVGMQRGDPQGAFLCASTLLSFKSAIGSPLVGLMNDSRKLFHQAKEHRQENLVPEFLLMWQYAANLQGLTSNPTRYDGQFPNEMPMMREIVEGESQAKFYYQYLRMMNCIFMGDWKEAEEPCCQIHQTILSLGLEMAATHYNMPLTYTYCGLAWYKRYAGTRDLNTLAKAKFARKVLHKWGSKGALNVITGLWVVDAQKAAADEAIDFYEVKKLFDKAISGLRRGGFRNLEALTCECFAQYCLDTDKEIAADYMIRAHGLYTEWGAMAKAKKLELEFGSSLFLGATIQEASCANMVRQFEDDVEHVKRGTWAGP